jgi:hypothetical protein
MQTIITKARFVILNVDLISGAEGLIIKQITANKFFILFLHVVDFQVNIFY